MKLENRMRVLVAEKCGFCPGVRNAITLAQRTLEAEAKVSSLGHIIHNEDVVKQFPRRDWKPSIPSTPSSRDRADPLARGDLGGIRQNHEKGLNIVDATCVLVKRVQKIARQLNEEGYKVVIIGDKTIRKSRPSWAMPGTWRWSDPSRI
jgi:4-hydroxy-3-methylbut-2-en-1-yl diphosphate reductase